MAPSIDLIKVRNGGVHFHKRFSLIVHATASARGPSTTDDNQLASKFARLVLQDDNAHVKHVQAPIVPVEVKKDPKPLSLKTELKGALRFNEQLNKNNSTKAGQEVGDKEGPREVKRRKTEVSSAAFDLDMSRLTAPGIY